MNIKKLCQDKQYQKELITKSIVIFVLLLLVATPSQCIAQQVMGGDLTIAVSRIQKVDNAGNLKAFADITLNGAFVVKGLRVVQGNNGLFVSMPSERANDGQWYNTAFPITAELRTKIQNTVLNEFKK